MDKLISVIVPVYQIAAYLSQCVDSILTQSHRELEILLIDDGSTDGSGAICDAYSARDARVRVIHQENGGAASAKNAGLRAAQGTYLAFVDGDDYLEPDAFARMLRAMTDAGADAVQGSFREEYQNSGRDVVMLRERQSFGAVDYLRRYTVDWTCGLLWDKLYKRSLFDGIFFEEGNVIDDEFFTYRGMMNAGTVLHIPDVVYHYRQRASGVMQVPEKKQRIVLDKLKYLNERRTQVLTRFPELKQEFDHHFLSMIRILSRDPAATEQSLTASRRMLLDYFQQGRPCRMELSLRLQLMKLMYARVQRLLDERNAPVPPDTSFVLFD